MGAFAGGKENGGHGSLESRRRPLPPWANNFLPCPATETQLPENRKTAAHVLACRGLYGVIRTASSRLQQALGDAVLAANGIDLGGSIAVCAKLLHGRLQNPLPGELSFLLLSRGPHSSYKN